MAKSFYIEEPRKGQRSLWYPPSADACFSIERTIAIMKRILHRMEVKGVFPPLAHDHKGNRYTLEALEIMKND